MRSVTYPVCDVCEYPVLGGQEGVVLTGRLVATVYPDTNVSSPGFGETGGPLDSAAFHARCLLSKLRITPVTARG